MARHKKYKKRKVRKYARRRSNPGSVIVGRTTNVYGRRSRWVVNTFDGSGTVFRTEFKTKREADDYAKSQRRRLKIRRGRQSNPRPPGISKWNTFAGGTFAAPGKYSYSIVSDEGRYYVSPVSTQYGRHRGYSVQFANDRGRLSGVGLWSDLGMVRSPAAGAKRAREHWDKNFGEK